MTPTAAQLLARNHKDELMEWMDRDLREWMGDIIPDDVRFGSQAGQVFKNLAGDFMLDVLDDVDAVLATGGMGFINIKPIYGHRPVLQQYYTALMKSSKPMQSNMKWCSGISWE